MPETRRHGPQDARRERAVKLLQDTVAAQLDSETYNVDIEHFGDAVLAAMDEVCLQLAEPLYGALLLRADVGDLRELHDTLPSWDEFRRMIALVVLDAEVTTVPVPREVLERASEAVRPVAGGDFGNALAAAARGERVEWPS